MRVVRFSIVPGAAVLTTLLLSSPAFAQVPTAPSTAPPAQRAAGVTEVRDELERLRKEFDAIRKAYDERLLALEQRLTQIGGGPLAPADAAAPVPPQDPQPPAAPQAAPTQSSKIFNPDTSVIGNLVGVGGKNPFNTQPAFQLSEAEV